MTSSTLFYTTPSLQRDRRQYVCRTWPKVRRSCLGPHPQEANSFNQHFKALHKPTRMATRPISCSAGTAAATTRRMLLGPRRPTPLPTTRTTVASFPIHSPSTSTAARTITSSTTTAINQPHRITTQQPLQRRAPPITAQTTRTYHSHDHPPPPGPFTPAEASLLSAAYAHVPAHGFTPSALALGARDTGLLDISPSILPDGDGSFSLIRWHLHVQKRALLKEEKLGGGGVHGGGGTMMTVEDKVEALAWARLRGNETAGVVGRWQEVCTMQCPLFVSRRSLLCCVVNEYTGDE
ncbi:hypothetical protein N658DRAFT_149474 [Parathielavia hyrcaniae]|uniref:Uncharacterized protein n=1 Tax=Parathielavia hyrcaniae TaxID=113614 RepID=A0AAN6Q2T6_9PEZI|nr:hypothetical protein N658DRAFT_149474 [Parathielavia hyrcaniae]